VTGAFVGLALAMTVHSVKSDLQTDNKFLACYQNILSPTNAGATVLPKNTVRYTHMRVISKPSDRTRPVLAPSPNVGPVIKGTGDMTYLCGECETSVLETVEYKQVRHLVVKCKKCGSYCDVPPSRHAY
jgi:DNA-directed RNA polymerase subunit RPC12/RpoP